MTETERIIYITAEYPVTTQTFVATEIAAVRALRGPVYEFPLRGFPPVDDEMYISARRAKLTRLAGLLGLAFRLPSLRAVLKVALARPRLGRRIPTQIYALSRALTLVAAARERFPSDSIHLHAHFLGRTCEVAYYASVLIGQERCGFSVTGHAADASNPVSSPALREILARARFVVCASKKVKDDLYLTTGCTNSTIVHCGVAKVDALQVPSNGDRLRILSVGRLVEKKGFDDALMAAALLRDSGLSFEWTFIGGGPLEVALREQSRDLRLDSMVRWLGHQSHDRVLNAMSNECDVFVLPAKLSHDGDVDGIPVALMEAMARRRVVVSSSIGGIPELIEHEKTGYLCVPGSVDSLSETLLTASRSGKRRAAMGDAAKEFVDCNFNQVVEASKMTALFGGAHPPNPSL